MEDVLAAAQLLAGPEARALVQVRYHVGPPGIASIVCRVPYFQAHRSPCRHAVGPGALLCGGCHRCRHTNPLCPPPSHPHTHTHMWVQEADPEDVQTFLALVVSERVKEEAASRAKAAAHAAAQVGGYVVWGNHPACLDMLYGCLPGSPILTPVPRHTPRCRWGDMLYGGTTLRGSPILTPPNAPLPPSSNAAAQAAAAEAAAVAAEAAYYEGEGEYDDYGDGDYNDRDYGRPLKRQKSSGGGGARRAGGGGGGGGGVYGSEDMGEMEVQGASDPYFYVILRGHPIPISVSTSGGITSDLYLICIQHPTHPAPISY